MKSPKTLMQDFVFSPLYKVYNNCFSKSARHKVLKSIANFVYEHGQETALIMLVFNAVSIISSHISHIIGLDKSNRENKEYLINQEKKEFFLDVFLTIIPPFLINNHLVNKLDSGKLTTRSSRDKLLNVILPVVGATPEEAYNTSHIVDWRITVKSSFKSILYSLKKAKKLPKFIINNFEINGPDINKCGPIVTMEDITLDFIKKKGSSFPGFYNGNAYDEICGQRNGILVMAAIAYTVLASNVLMPIAKNILANKSYKKQMQKMQQENALNQKLSFSKNNNKSLIIKNSNSIFSDFVLSEPQSNGNIFQQNFKSYNSPYVKTNSKTSVFTDFTSYKKNYPSSSSIKV